MDSQDLSNSCDPCLVGTTGQFHDQSISPTEENKSSISISVEHETTPVTQPASTDLPTGSSIFFKSLQWSADGTTLLTTSTDCALRSFVLPSTLLQPPQPHSLQPYVTHTLPEPTYAAAIYPFYNLAEPTSCLLVASVRMLPIRLYSTLGGGVLGSYPLIHPTTETYIAPHSFLFSPSQSNEFLAGSNGIIALFDLNRPGEDPVSIMRTGRKRRARSGTAAMASEADNGLKGIVSTMDMNCDGIMAAGTFSRNVGLYDNYGRGETNAIFSINDNDNSHTKDEIKGNGITQVKWDPSGRYLCIAERGTNGISIWDIRRTGHRLAWLRGRKANTQQRMGVEVSSSMNGGEVWAGGTDGIVRVWGGLGMREGTLDRDWEFKAHGDAVNGVGMHPCGAGVLATCSGQRHFDDLDGGQRQQQQQQRRRHDDDDVLDGWERSSVTAESQAAEAEVNSFDDSLKIWAL